MSWKAHLPNFANWASTIAKLSQVFTTSSQIRRPRKWKLSERGTLECVENICDLIISPCQSVSCNAGKRDECLSHAICLFSFELPQTLTSLTFTDITQVKLHDHKVFKRKVFILFYLLDFNEHFSQEYGRDKKCKNGESLWCIPIYVFAFTVLSPSDWTTDWLSVVRL